MDSFYMRIYQKKFTNVSFEQVYEWITKNNVDIVNINANMQFGKRGALSMKRWYFQFFVIDYVMSSNCHMYRCLFDYGSVLKKRKLTSCFDNFLSDKIVIFDMSREERLSNGEGSLSLARFAIYDDIVYEGGF